MADSGVSSVTEVFEVTAFEDSEFMRCNVAFSYVTNWMADSGVSAVTEAFVVTDFKDSEFMRCKIAFSYVTKYISLIIFLWLTHALCR